MIMQTQWSVIIEILKRIGDIKFQEDIWVKQKHNHPLLSFGETVNTLEDYFFFDSIKNRELKLSEKNYKILDQYIKSLISYTEPKDTSLMLTDLKWINIVQATESIIDILKANVPVDSNDLRNFYSWQ